MRILFFTWRANLRQFEDLAVHLIEAGHELVLAYPSTKPQKLPSRLRVSPNATLVGYDEVSDARHGRSLRVLRQTRDYLWYLSPEQRGAAFNRRHSLRRLLRTLTEEQAELHETWPDPLVQLDDAERAALDGALAALEQRIPPDPSTVALIRDNRPDAVLVSPLVQQEFQQSEAVKAARSLGVPTGFLVYSWDNLSNKGRVHAAPDRIFVWNELQRWEATELHDLDPESVTITGAPHWDGFFDLEPSATREDFCRRHGFEPALPIVLYLGSTTRICPDEPRVVERWLAAARSAGGPLASANVLVRPHPDEARRWAEWRPNAERVSLSRRSHRRDQGLYDELHHSAAAVGLNTSAQIEAAIVGRPVYTFSAGADAPGQGGTLHFYYLLKERGGVVTYAETLDEHMAQLGRGVAGEYDREAIRRFCQSFVRPRGLDRPVTPILAEEVLALAQTRNRALTAA